MYVQSSVMPIMVLKILQRSLKLPDYEEVDEFSKYTRGRRGGLGKIGYLKINLHNYSVSGRGRVFNKTM